MFTSTGVSETGAFIIKPLVRRYMSLTSLLLCASALEAFVVPVRAAEDPNKVDESRFWYAVNPMTRDLDRSLMDKYGYAYETTEQIMDATQSRLPMIRKISLRLLAERIGAEAIPVLRKFLRDPEVTVRLKAAELLGHLGDPSGVPQLRKDYTEWVVRYENGVCDSGKPPSSPRISPRPRATPDEALKIADALARFGDNRGFEFAAKIALSDPVAHLRWLAAGVLVEVERNSRSAPLGQAPNVGPVLLMIAQSDTSKSVLQRVVTAANHMHGDIKMRIWDAVVTRSDAPPAVREQAKKHLEETIRQREERKREQENHS